MLPHVSLTIDEVNIGEPIDSTNEPLQYLYVIGSTDKELILERLVTAGFNIDHYNVILINSANDIPSGYKVCHTDDIDLQFDDLDCNITQLISLIPYQYYEFGEYDKILELDNKYYVQELKHRQHQYDKKQSKAYKTCKRFKPINNSRAYARSILNHTTKHR